MGIEFVLFTIRAERVLLGFLGMVVDLSFRGRVLEGVAAHAFVVS